MALPAVYEFKYKPSNTTGDKTSFLLGTSVGDSLNFYLYNNFNDVDTDLNFKGKNVTWNSYTQLSLKSEYNDEKKASIEITGETSSITISANTTTINGNIASATIPTEANHLTNKAYVDTEKVSIDSGIMKLEDIKSAPLPTGVQPWNEWDTFVYVYSPKAEKTEGGLRFPEGPKWIRLSQEWDPQNEDSTGSLTAVQRTSVGTILAADPINAHDVATKGYVDSKKLYSSWVSFKYTGSVTHEIWTFYTISTKKIPNLENAIENCLYAIKNTDDGGKMYYRDAFSQSGSSAGYVFYELGTSNYDILHYSGESYYYWEFLDGLGNEI